MHLEALLTQPAVAASAVGPAQAVQGRPAGPALPSKSATGHPAAAVLGNASGTAHMLASAGKAAAKAAAKAARLSGAHADQQPRRRTQGGEERLPENVMLKVGCGWSWAMSACLLSGRCDTQQADFMARECCLAQMAGLVLDLVACMKQGGICHWPPGHVMCRIMGASVSASVCRGVTLCQGLFLRCIPQLLERSSVMSSAKTANQTVAARIRVASAIGLQVVSCA